MSTPSAGLSQLPAPRGLTLAPRQFRHSWTNEELNLLAYHRAHHWTFDRIRKTHFPSLTKKSLIQAYGRLPIEQRAYRVSVVAALVTTSHGASRSEDTTHPVPGPSHRSRPTSQPEGNAEAPKSSTLRHKEDNRPVASIDGTANRYNLRPNRRKSFQRSKPRYLVDRLHFPHFFKSYQKHLKLHGVPDGDYAPPSHSPTPDSSDRSPSVASSLPSVSSSLELFGLEARSPSSSDCGPSDTSSQPSDVSSPEFFSSEERLPTP